MVRENHRADTRKMPGKSNEMTGAQLGSALEEMGWSASRLARYLDVSDDTVRRWVQAKGDRVPGPAAVAVNLMLDIRWLARQAE